MTFWPFPFQILKEATTDKRQIQKCDLDYLCKCKVFACRVNNLEESHTVISNIMPEFLPNILQLHKIVKILRKTWLSHNTPQIFNGNNYFYPYL
jgi:hypothetical protein